MSPNDSTDDAESKNQNKKLKKGKNAGAKKDGKSKKPQNVDVRHILGFLNQTEWI